MLYLRIPYPQHVWSYHTTSVQQDKIVAVVPVIVRKIWHRGYNPRKKEKMQGNNRYHLYITYPPYSDSLFLMLIIIHSCLYCLMRMAKSTAKEKITNNTDLQNKRSFEKLKAIVEHCLHTLVQDLQSSYLYWVNRSIYS